MDSSVTFAICAALAFSVGSLLSKALARYRICDSGYITFGTGVAGGACALCAVLVLRLEPPRAPIMTLAGLLLAILSAQLFVNRALQEGDPSSVVPVLGTKIPLSAMLAFVFLGERHPWHVYGATLIAAGSVTLFVIGPQERAQGGHQHAPWISIVCAGVAALSFAVADQFAKLSLDYAEPLTIVLWVNIVLGIVSLVMLRRPHYRQYSIAPGDCAVFAARGLLNIVGVVALYFAFDRANGVTVPNVILASRGLLILVFGYVLGKRLSTPMEHQPAKVYVFRALGTGLLLGAITIATWN